MKHYIITNEDNEVIEKLKIHQTVDRPNDPDDDTIIADFMLEIHGISNYIAIEFDEYKEYYFIGEDYCVVV